MAEVPQYPTKDNPPTPNVPQQQEAEPPQAQAEGAPAPNDLEVCPNSLYLSGLFCSDIYAMAYSCY